MSNACGRKGRHWSQRRLEVKKLLDTTASVSLLDKVLAYKELPRQNIFKPIYSLLARQQQIQRAYL